MFRYVLISLKEAIDSQDALRTINLRHCRAGVNTLEMCVELLGASMTGSRQRLEICG